MSRPIFKKKIKNGRVYFFYRLRHTQLRKPLDMYAKTETELKAKIKSKEYELDRGVTSDKAFFGDYLKKWLDAVHINGKKEGTVHNYYVCYDNHIKGSPVEKIRLKDLSALDLQDYYQSIIDTKGINVVKSIHKMVCPCLRYAFANQKILMDFTRAIKLPAPKEKDEDEVSRVLTRDEQEKFIKAIKGATYEVLFLTALNTGLRIGELLALTWDDLSFESKEISVSKQMTYTKDRTTKRYTNKITAPKTKAGTRVIPVPEFLIPRLKELRVKELEKKMRLQNKCADLNLVFSAKLGGYLAFSSVRTSLDTIIKENKIEHFKIHSLRHTYATRLFELGEQPKTVQALLGHSDIAMTMNVYTHVLKDISAISAGKMDTLHNELLCKAE
ncbi:site-specific integrase [Acetobacterium sp.]|uniref:site-specific integrase n=1 Tax=Acetobacterium sp. TaxID=1872094 RepID=UPI002723D5A3|nr:site-specific integrase [Acetobacterium sp.]MDO9490791.1 site-specific integrase [Acetobacterium sp.]